MLFVQLDARPPPAIEGAVVVEFCDLVTGGAGATDVDGNFEIDEKLGDTTDCVVTEWEVGEDKEFEEIIEAGSDEVEFALTDDGTTSDEDELAVVDRLRDIDSVEEVEKLDDNEALVDVTILANPDVLDDVGEDKAEEIDETNLPVDASEFEVEEADDVDDEDDDVEIVDMLDIDTREAVDVLDEIGITKLMALGVLN